MRPVRVVITKLITHESLVRRGCGRFTAMPQDRIRVSLFEKRTVIDSISTDLHRLHRNPDLLLLERGVRSERAEIRQQIGNLASGVGRLLVRNAMNDDNSDLLF